MDEIRILRLSGKQFLPYLEQLGNLRIQIFREFPYLYEGSLDYEKDYLKVYADESESLIMGLLLNDLWIGATTAIPLSAETANVQKPFHDAGYNINTVFYFGESILLPEHRGKGYGHLFFNEREKFALEKGYTITSFCSVIRPNDHPLKPADYRSNDSFWAKRNYIKQNGLRCSMSWMDVGQAAETEKELVFWTKEWK